MGPVDEMVEAYQTAYRSRFGFIMPGKGVIAATISVEAIGLTFDVEAGTHVAASDSFTPLATVDAYMGGAPVTAPVYRRESIPAGGTVDGPALITEATATTIVEPGWQAEMTEIGNLVLRRVVAREERMAIGTSCDPVMLEVFNNLFMSIAEQMGYTLQNLSLIHI